MVSCTETLNSLRGWIDAHHCVPKSIVADMAFVNGADFISFYRSHNIRPIPTGPRTPWPNPAETAVRLFKRQFRLLVSYAAEDPSRYSGVTADQFVKTCSWARNNQLTISGKAPIELAFGRRPPDLLDYETSSPEELTIDPLSQDKLDREVRKLALRAHLEARQHDDLMSDLAQHVRPSEGPFNPGERVFVWEKDHSKVSDT